MEQKMLIVDSLNHLPENPYETITMDFEKSYAVKWYAILVYEDEELVGFMHVFRHPEQTGLWCFSDVHTKAEYRKRQIATKMYESALKLVKQYDKAYCVMASVHPENIASLKLHQKFGFVDSHKKSEFGDFVFEPKETMHFCYFVSIFPSINNEMIKTQLYPLWKMYSQEFQKNVNDESVEQAVNEMLLQTEKEESIQFDRIWAGDNLIGFIRHSCDKENAREGIFQKDKVMDCYILPAWRKNWSNLIIV